MDHQKIKAAEIVDRYLLGKLSEPEEEAFEKHFFNCDQCFAEVQTAEKAIRGIQDAAARGVLLKDKTMPRPAFGWLERLRAFFSPSPVIVFATLVLALIYPAYRGMVTVSQLQSELAALRRPRANAQTYVLQATRDAAGVEKIAVSPEDETFVLTFNILEKKIEAPHYRAEILDHEGRAIWREENLKGLGPYKAFSVACRSAFFKEGFYTLKVYEVDPANQQTAAEFLFPFEVVGQKTDGGAQP